MCTDPQIRLEVEAQLRAANRVSRRYHQAQTGRSGCRRRPPPDLTNGRIISLKEEYSAWSSFNIGQQAGHQDRDAVPDRASSIHAVGRARIVDVRDTDQRSSHRGVQFKRRKS